MIFNTPAFFLFFVVFLLVYGVILLRQKPRLYFTLVASLVFYGAWNYRFIPLLVGSAVADYFIALALGRATETRRRKLLLALSISINLGILSLFKYADFVLGSVSDLLQAFGFQASVPTLALVLPVGISFYTFQSMSYTIDVYRGDMPPRKGLVAFTAALSFFPQLVAGPILRAREILPQFHNLPVPTWETAKHGFLLITVGLMKKTGADLLAIPAQTAFDATAPISMMETWTGVLAFAGQIYGDFSGYSDMAIGVALVLGYQIPLNFRLPYLAISPAEFWRRWHISLSSWLRDYLYIPLGGNRKSRHRNIIITMLLGGLWHGAAWTFVAWGAFHGAIIAATHVLRTATWYPKPLISNQHVAKVLGCAFTFYLVLLGWVLFRATSLESAFEIMANMHGLAALPVPDPLAPILLALTVAGLLCMHAVDYVVLNHSDKLEKKAWIFWPLLFGGQSLCLLIGKPSTEFIYFQF